MVQYSVKKLFKLTGVSVRTLHHYDQQHLLKPSIRTKAGYRLYGEKELLRLQQILFYKELDFSLAEILNILDDPEFDLLQALEQHKAALQTRQERIATLLITIDKTMYHLKNGIMLTPEDSYAGLPKEKAEAYRKEAMKKWQEQVEESEKQLLKMIKSDLNSLKDTFAANLKKLVSVSNQDPTISAVQEEIARHYQLIRQFWGTADSPDKQAEAYTG